MVKTYFLGRSPHLKQETVVRLSNMISTSVLPVDIPHKFLIAVDGYSNCPFWVSLLLVLVRLVVDQRFETSAFFGLSSQKDRVLWWNSWIHSVQDGTSACSIIVHRWVSENPGQNFCFLPVGAFKYLMNRCLLSTYSSICLPPEFWCFPISTYFLFSPQGETGANVLVGIQVLDCELDEFCSRADILDYDYTDETYNSSRYLEKLWLVTRWEG